PAEVGSVPDWLGAAIEDAGGDVPEFEDTDMPEPVFEDLFGSVDDAPDAPAEVGSVPDWLGAVMEEPEEAAPSGFTDLLAAYEAQHPAANQIDDVERAGEGMPPEWETALTGDDGKVVSSEPDGFERDDEAEFFAAFDEVAPEFDFGSAFAMPDEPSFDEEPETSFMTSELPGDDSGTVTPEELEALRLATMPPPDTDFSEFMEPEVPADVDFLAPAVEWSDRIAPPHAEQTELDEASIQTGQWVAESESMISEASTEIEEWVAGFEDVVSPPISAMPDSDASAEAEWAGMNDDTGEAAVDDWLDDLSVPDEAELFEPVPEVEQEIAPVPPVESASVGEEPTQLWVSEQVEEDPDWMPSGAPDDDWLGSFAKPPTGELFPGYEEPEESGVGMEDEWVSQEDDLTVGFTPTGEVDDMAPAHLDDVFDSVGGVEDGELGTIPDLVETFGSEEIEFAESGVSQADIFPDDEAPAWMADIAPIEMSTRSVLDSAYDPFEGGSADQVPEYRSASETGILQPDESPDWMMAFSDDDLPVDGDLESAAFGDEAVSLDDLDLGFDFGAAPDVVSRDKPITDSLADMTFDEPDDVESDSAELDEQALAAEGDGEMPDWLMAITSSESDQLEDTVWDEPDTYSSAEDTGVLQPSSQPDWLVDMAESPDEEAPLTGESGEVDVLLNNLFDDMDIDEAQGTPGLGKRMADAGDVVDADEDFFAALGAAAGDAGTDLDLDEMMAGVGDVGGDAVEISDADDDFFAALGAAAGDAEADLDLSEIMAGARDVADVAAVPDADEDFFAALEAADEDVEIGLDLGEIIADAAEADAEFFAALDAAEAQPGVAQPADLPHTKVVELDADDDFDDDLGDDDFGPGNFAFDGKQPAWLRKPKESDNAPLMADQGPAPESPEWLRDAFENDESDS
ncbi:MAG: hypothetical protein JXQ72_10370, partial [Anaerolineae bacterium]|nr:hypothetical protein [Anaerolineae bacterium]